MAYLRKNQVEAISEALKLLRSFVGSSNPVYTAATDAISQYVEQYEKQVVWDDDSAEKQKRYRAENREMINAKASAYYKKKRDAMLIANAIDSSDDNADSYTADMDAETNDTQPTAPKRGRPAGSKDSKARVRRTKTQIKRAEYYKKKQSALMESEDQKNDTENNSPS